MPNPIFYTILERGVYGIYARHPSGQIVKIVRCYPGEWAVFIMFAGVALPYQMPEINMPYPKARRLARAAYNGIPTAATV